MVFFVFIPSLFNMRSWLGLYLTGIFILLSLPGTAQSSAQAGSLDSMLGKIADPKEKADAILDYLNKTENLYLENADKLAGRALEIAQQSGYAKGRINAMLKLGNYYFRGSDYKKAMEFAQRAKELSGDLSYNTELANSLSLIGTIYTQLGDYDNSSQHFFKSLRISEKLDDKEGIARSLGDIGKDFYKQQEYKKALEYFNNSLTLSLKLGKLPEIKRQYNNIAVVYGDLQKYDTAETFLRKALDISVRLGDRFGQGINIMNIGYGQMNKGRYGDALVNFQQSLDLFTGLNNRLHMAECYVNFGFCYYSAGRTDEGITYFVKALQEGKENGYYSIIASAANILNKIYTERKDTINAYKYVMLEKLAGDSLFASQKQKLLSKLELQYVYEKKEFKKQLAQQVNNTIIFIVILCLLSGLVILALIFSKHRLKAKFVLLEKEKVEAELRIKDRELTVNLISLIRKSEMISDLSNKLIQLELNAKGSETKEAISKISQELRHSTDNKMHNEFSRRFQEVHVGFYEKLLKAYPDLTKNELKLCAFLRLNMSTKDISVLTGQRLPSIDHARYRLRKKLGLSNSETNLVAFLARV